MSFIPYPNVLWDEPDNFKIAKPCSDVLVERPFEKFGDTKTRLYKQKYSQARTSFAPLTIDSGGPIGGKLVDETVWEDKGAGIGEWWRVFADLPQSHDEPESYVYNMQNIVIQDGSASLAEVAKIVTSRVQCDYFWAPRGISTIPIIYALKLVELGGVVYATPDASYYPLKPNSNGEVVAEDSTIKRWIGNYYERRTRFVQFATIAQIP